jgi:hypothetical protein
MLRPNDPAANLTVREYFALFALQGLLSASETVSWTYEGFAANAVAYADALIARLNGATAPPFVEEEP